MRMRKSLSYLAGLNPTSRVGGACKPYICLAPEGMRNGRQWPTFSLTQAYLYRAGNIPWTQLGRAIGTS